MIHLTDPEIDALPAGRQLDALIAAEVFGRPFREVCHRGYCDHCGGNDDICEREYCRYSMRSDASFIVINRLGEPDFGFWCKISTPFRPGVKYFSGFTPHGTSGWNGRPDHESPGESFELSVARAALKAVAAKQRQEAIEGEAVAI